MDKETKQMFELVLNKLDGVEKKQDNMGKKQDRMEIKLDNMSKRQDRMEIKLDDMSKRQDGMETKLDGMSKRQDEMYVMQRGLEENIKVTRAEQNKMMYVLSDIQGKVTKLTGEVEEHENFISQIRSIK